MLQVISDLQSLQSYVQKDGCWSTFERVISVLSSLVDSKPLKITEHFTVEEFLASPTAVRHNLTLTPNPRVFSNLTNLCVHVLEPARCKLGKPIIVTSGYRSQSLNRLVGGSPTSFHLSGRAADIVAPSGEHNRLFNILAELPHVELIDYKTFIHVAL